MTRFLRARQPEQKDERRRAILEAARALAREVGAIELSLNELGRRSGVSKPNIYRYFESREDVLLQLFVLELEDVVAAIEGGLAKKNVRGDQKKIASCLVRAFLDRPLFCELLVIVAAILEHNLSVKAIASSKAEVIQGTVRVADALRSVLPGLSAAKALWATQTIAFYVAGLWPHAYPSANADEVLGRPEFAGFKPKAERDLVMFVRVLLAGMSRPNSDK